MKWSFGSNFVGTIAGCAKVEVGGLGVEIAVEGVEKLGLVVVRGLSFKLWVGRRLRTTGLRL